MLNKSKYFSKFIFSATDGTNLYVTDYTYNLIHKVVISRGVVTTLAGTGSSDSAIGTGTAASFNGPAGLSSDGTNLYVGEYSNHLIRKIVISTGVVTTLAGSGTVGSTNVAGTAAKFNYPKSITSDGTTLYVADVLNHMIRQID